VASAIARVSCSIITGLLMMTRTPVGFSPLASIRSPKPVSMMIGLSGATRAIVAATASPLISGIARSVMTRSNQPDMNFSRPSTPLSAVSTVCPTARSCCESTLRTTGSSSTTRMRRRRGDSSASGPRAAAADGEPSGKRRLIVVPAPGRLSILSVPRCRSMRACTSESPSPLPCWPFVEKNGSRQRRRTSSLMPTPVSATSTRTPSPSGCARTVIVPPAGIASTALKIRLVSISRSSVSSPTIGGSRSATSVSMRIVTPMASAWLRQRGAVSATASLMQRSRFTGASVAVSTRSR